STYKELQDSLRKEHEMLIQRITCCNKDFINIIPKNKWNLRKLENMSLSNMSSLFQDLYQSYAKHLGLRNAFLNKKLVFYDYITYIVLNIKDPVKLKFHVGDIIELVENSEKIIYTRIRTIFTHQGTSEKTYAFFQCDRFQEMNVVDPILGCLLYKVRASEGAYIFLINYVNHIPQISTVLGYQSSEDATIDDA
ncbi:4548_t:CDS:2, partial [Cetraspora pellucida]